MENFVANFKRIIPSLREEMMAAIEEKPLKGKRMEIPCRDCLVEVFVHRAEKDNAPVLFEFHGGGLVLGDARKNDELRETIKEALDINVVGVNYRKAPEFPYPSAIYDAYDVVKYFYEQAKELRVDKERFALMGFSAGATLATVTAMKAAKSRAFSIKYQILYYPYLDGATKASLKKRHPADLPVEVMEAFVTLYGGDPKHAYVSPLYATKKQREGMAPALLIMAGEDALCEEGNQYSKLLIEAGVPVNAVVMEEMHHGYMEDYYNKECYALNPPDILALHSSKMELCAKESLQYAMQDLMHWLK